MPERYACEKRPGDSGSQPAIAEANERLHKINPLAAKELLSGDVLAEKLRDISVKLTELRGQRRRIPQNGDVESAERGVRKLIGLLRRGPESQKSGYVIEALFETRTARMSPNRSRRRKSGGRAEIRRPKRTVRIIPVTKSPAASAKKNVILRVAAYCRVSTDSEEQINA